MPTEGAVVLGGGADDCCCRPRRDNANAAADLLGDGSGILATEAGAFGGGNAALAVLLGVTLFSIETRRNKGFGTIRAGDAAAWDCSTASIVVVMTRKAN